MKADILNTLVTNKKSISTVGKLKEVYIAL